MRRRTVEVIREFVTWALDPDKAAIHQCQHYIIKERNTYFLENYDLWHLNINNDLSNFSFMENFISLKSFRVN